MIHASYTKLYKEIKIGIEILVDQVFFKMDQNIQNNVLINNSRTAYPTEIQMPFLSSFDNWL